VIDCKAGERKRRITKEYLAEHAEVRAGVFLILVSRSPAAGVEARPVREGRDPSPGEDPPVRQPRLVSQ
jgi:hypothetical protein